MNKGLYHHERGVPRGQSLSDGVDLLALDEADRHLPAPGRCVRLLKRSLLADVLRLVDAFDLPHALVSVQVEHEILEDLLVRPPIALPLVDARLDLLGHVLGPPIRDGQVVPDPPVAPLVVDEVQRYPLSPPPTGVLRRCFRRS